MVCPRESWIGCVGRSSRPTQARCCSGPIASTCLLARSASARKLFASRGQGGRPPGCLRRGRAGSGEGLPGAVGPVPRRGHRQDQTHSLRTREANLLDRLRELDAGIVREQAKPPNRQDAERLTRLFDQRREAENQQVALVATMERENPQYAALKYPRPCSIEQARACLAADEVALMYVLGSEASYLIVVTKDAAPGAAGIAIFELKAAGEIATIVSQLTRKGDLGNFRGIVPVDSAIRGDGSENARGSGLPDVDGACRGVDPREGPGDRAGGAHRLFALRAAGRFGPAPDRRSPHPLRPLAHDTGLHPPLGQGQAPTGSCGFSPLATRSIRGPVWCSNACPAAGSRLSDSATLMKAAPDDILLGEAATEETVKKMSANGNLAALPLRPFRHARDSGAFRRRPARTRLFQ